jgi:2-desacetyl-2-hydroxyethyl bacteriochlorophyllide A dehydrogenase
VTTLDRYWLTFEEPGQVAIRSERLDNSVGDNQVLVRNRCSLISAGTELAVFTAVHPGLAVPGHWATFPWCPGYASVGVVEAVGARAAEVLGVAIGDRVFHESSHATWSVVEAARVQVVPDDVPDERAVFTKALTIAMTALRSAPVRFGDRIAILGLGVIGNLSAQLAREAGAFTVTAYDRADGRRRLARRCGIERADDPDGSDCTQQDADLVIEATGAAASVAAATRYARPGGRVVLLGSPRTPVTFDAYFSVHLRGLSIVGAHESVIGVSQRRADEPFTNHLLASGRVLVEPLVTHRIAFRDAQVAYEGLQDRRDEFVTVVLEYS